MGLTAIGGSEVGTLCAFPFGAGASFNSEMPFEVCRGYSMIPITGSIHALQINVAS